MTTFHPEYPADDILIGAGLYNVEGENTHRITSYERRSGAIDVSSSIIAHDVVLIGLERVLPANGFNLGNQEVAKVKIMRELNSRGRALQGKVPLIEEDRLESECKKHLELAQHIEGIAPLAQKERLFTESGKPFYAVITDRAKKGTLKGFRADTPQLAEYYFKLKRPIVAALAGMHALEWVDCDVKPSNFFWYEATEDKVEHLALGDLEAVNREGTPAFVGGDMAAEVCDDPDATLLPAQYAGTKGYIPGEYYQAGDIVKPSAAVFADSVADVVTLTGDFPHEWDFALQRPRVEGDIRPDLEERLAHISKERLEIIIASLGRPENRPTMVEKYAVL